MLHREIDDLELKMLEAGELISLTGEERIEGLIKRLRRVEAESATVLEAASLVNENYAVRIQHLEKLRTHDDNLRMRFLREAAAEALKRGGPHIFNRWRNWTTTPFDMADVCAAICEALTHNGVTAWNGDGVSIVAQMVEAGHRRAEKAEAERDAYRERSIESMTLVKTACEGRDAAEAALASTEKARDEFKEDVDAVHALCDHAGISNEQMHYEGAAPRVVKRPAWMRVEMLVTHGLNHVLTTVNPMVRDAADSMLSAVGITISKKKKKTRAVKKPGKSRPRGRKQRTKR